MVFRLRGEWFLPARQAHKRVSAQHYFMGGIKVNLQSKTSMDRLYAVGETACNGVHGRNRLASNSLLESMVFAKRAAVEMSEQFNDREFDRNEETVDFDKYKDLHAWNKENKQMILDLIEESKKQREKADA